MNQEVYFYNNKAVLDTDDIKGARLPVMDVIKRLSFAEWRPGLDLGLIHAEGIRITMEIYDNPSEIEVRTAITARGKGDEALRLLHENLKRISESTHRTVVHIGEPTNKAATNLFKRHHEYAKQPHNSWKLIVSPS